MTCLLVLRRYFCCCWSWQYVSLLLIMRYITYTHKGLDLPDVADDFGYDMPGQRQKKVSERRWGVPSTTWRQVMCNTSNSSGDGTLTMVPLCRGLSGTKITLGKWWKSRGQVGKLWTLQEGLYTTCTYSMTHPGVIYHDSEGDVACAIISLLIVMSHKDSSLMTKKVTRRESFLIQHIVIMTPMFSCPSMVFYPIRRQMFLILHMVRSSQDHVHFR